MFFNGPSTACSGNRYISCLVSFIHLILRFAGITPVSGKFSDASDAEIACLDASIGKYAAVSLQLGAYFLIVLMFVPHKIIICLMMMFMRLFCIKARIQSIGH